MQARVVHWAVRGTQLRIATPTDQGTVMKRSLIGMLACITLALLSVLLHSASAAADTPIFACVTLTNNTSETIPISGTTVDGIWDPNNPYCTTNAQTDSTGAPKGEIAPGQTLQFSTASDGAVFTGTDGSLGFTLQAGAYKAAIEWSVPWLLFHGDPFPGSPCTAFNVIAPNGGSSGSGSTFSPPPLHDKLTGGLASSGTDGVDGCVFNFQLNDPPSSSPPLGSAEAYPCWTQVVPGSQAQTSGMALAVTPNNVPFVVGAPSGQVFSLRYLGGLPYWQPEAPIPGGTVAIGVAVDESGNVFVQDPWLNVWKDSSGTGLGPWLFVPSQFSADVSFFTVMTTSLAPDLQVGVNIGATNGQLTRSTPLWWTGLTSPSFQSNFTFTLPSGPDGALAAAGFVPACPAPCQFQGSLETPWVVTQGGMLLATNDGSSWGQQPGWNVTSITDHFVVGSGGSVYWWNDGAANLWPFQVTNGNWNGPVLPPTPNGIRQIAHVQNGGLWAIDNSGAIYTNTIACSP
jgi:hypothetical protein